MKKNHIKFLPSATAFARTVFILSFFTLCILSFIHKTNHNTPVHKITNPIYAYTKEAEETAVNSPYVYGAVASAPVTSAQAAALISADTGEALYLYNADTPLPMASTTKIMTALTVIENCDTESIVTVPAEYCGIEGSSIYLVPGEKLSVTDLLYGLLLESGNDAAAALAYACSGNIPDFVSLMNKRARSMGLTLTHFDNPHGLSSEKHYTSARELAIIAYHAMKNPVFRKIAGTVSYTVKDSNGIPVKYFSNHNKMLRSYNGATGLKTGYTLASGRCLVTSAERNGAEFIAVTLNDRNDFKDHAHLLDFAFENYTPHIFISPGSITGCFEGMNFKNAEGITAILPKNLPCGKKEFTVTLTNQQFSYPG